MRKDYTAEAEALFRAFAARHAFAIEEVDEPNVEVLMRVPAQHGLSFDLLLGLQNADEVNIGFDKFWSYIFPFERVRDHVERVLDAVVAGDCRLAVHKQFGVITLRALELRQNGEWRMIYRANDVRIPFIGTKVSYLSNTAADSRSA